MAFSEEKPGLFTTLVVQKSQFVLFKNHVKSSNASFRLLRKDHKIGGWLSADTV